MIPTVMRFAVLVLMAVTSSVVSAQGARPAAETRIWDVRANRFVGESKLVTELAAARYRLLGEVHDNAAHHVIRARLIAAIASTGARPAVVLEQFDLDHDETLIAAQAGGADAEQLAKAGQLDRKGWQWPLHKPILEAALAHHLPIRAGNLPRAQLREEEHVADERSKTIGYARFRAARWTEAQAAALRADIVAAHCGQAPGVAIPRIVLAQRLRDAATAQALVDAATPSGAILIGGNGHVRSDLGVPVYLHAPGQPDAGARSMSLGLIEVTPEDELAADFPRQVVSANPGFDYLWLTPPAVREDPCANLKMPAR
ncbi:MAG TPA: ChaN family lipoprotein [Casimicrobiaceae bacterium]|jgi:uncharacterized iron-regulated protein|nr:ChaN family lipoprotein [Casimicrobiaceae bacterium]